MSIILCGLPMSGKTTVGKLLAKKLDYHFIDTDQLIAEAYIDQFGNKKSCREIHRECGEDNFRIMESQQILSLTTKLGRIISIGGGSLIKIENVNHLKKIGTLIYLETNIETICERMLQKGIPSFLDAAKPEESLRKTAAARIPIYEAHAHMTIATNNLAPTEIVEQIVLNLFKRKGAKKQRK